MMKRHHTIISGTGRNGTTFLMQLLTVLGLDTGFADHTSYVYENCNAGMEWDIRRPNSPYIIKSPWLCDYLDDIMLGGEYAIDHAFIPVRDLYSAAESRRDVTRRSNAADFPNEIIPGGIWEAETPDKQEEILRDRFYKLIYALAKHDIPTTLLHFPRVIHEPDYLFRKLAPTLQDIDYRTFRAAFSKVVNPSLVHHFDQDQHEEEPLVKAA